jgi:hypothetical protein
MMLYRTLRGCPYFGEGKWVEDGDDGMVQEVEIIQRDGRACPMGFKGLTVPIELVRTHMVAILRKGYDKRI